MIALTFAVLPTVSMAYDWKTGIFGPLPLIGFVYWSGIWAAALILLTLAITPCRHLFRWNRVIDARRILGVSAFVYSSVHLVGYFALYRWDWTGILKQIVTRPTLIIATASLVGLAALGLTSSDPAIRWLGAGNWHILHRANYLISALAIAHFLLSPGIFNLQYVMAGLLFWLLAWRLLHRLRAEQRPLTLALLAAAASMFALAIEIVWLWAYQQVPPEETFELMFNFVDEVPAPWQVFGIGVLVAISAALFVRQPRPVSPKDAKQHHGLRQDRGANSAATGRVKSQ
jgi:sulfoxide reductase heme-binding subunit YedZ